MMIEEEEESSTPSSFDIKAEAAVFFLRTARGFFTDAGFSSLISVLATTSRGATSVAVVSGRGVIGGGASER